MTAITERSLELAAIACEAAAQACQSGATLQRRRGLDPLARDYLLAAEQLRTLSAQHTSSRGGPTAKMLPLACCDGAVDAGTEWHYRDCETAFPDGPDPKA